MKRADYGVGLFLRAKVDGKIGNLLSGMNWRFLPNIQGSWQLGGFESRGDVNFDFYCCGDVTKGYNDRQFYWRTKQ
jgi:hypothetical protein